MVTILVTGAHGFIGTHLYAALQEAGHTVRPCVRNSSDPAHIAVGDMEAFKEWDAVMQGVDVVIHLAARVHQVKDSASDPEAAFTRANVTVTQRLLEAAERAGVKHFIFFSTIAVMGIDSGNIAMPASTLHPLTPYGRSKAQAEALVQASPLTTTIIRIPLVYGAGVRANFLSLINAVDKGLPLPFDRVRNQRNFLYVGNLTDAVLTLLTLPHPPDMLLLADRETPSMPDLIRAIASALGKKARLLPVPPLLLKTGAMLLGKTMLYHQCCSSLVMDTTPSNAALHWSPPFTLEEGLRETIQWYRTHG